MKVTSISELHRAYAGLPVVGDLFRYRCGNLVEVIMVPAGAPIHGAFAIGQPMDGHVTWVPGLEWALEKRSIGAVNFDRICLVSTCDCRTKYAALPRRSTLKPGTVFRYAPVHFQSPGTTEARGVWFVAGGPYWKARTILGQTPELSHPGEGDLRRGCEILWDPEGGWAGAAAAEIVDYENQHKQNFVGSLAPAPNVTPEGKRLPAPPKYDGLTLRECLVRHDVLVKQQERGLGEPDTTLTDLQKEIVSKELSRQVREGVRARQIAEKNRIPCQGDYFDD